MKSLVSIIVPVYNGEKYLAKCLESILLQTYPNFELILINDGSTDSSGDICQLYVQKDKRIHFINKVNAGVSEARNDGLKKATGEYIMFVDSDDWLDKRCLEFLLANLLEYKCDLSIVGYREIEIDGKLDSDTSLIGFERLMTAEETMEHLFQAIDFFSLCYPWGKLYKKSIIDENHLCFDKRIAIGEDRLFIFEYLLHCKWVFCSSTAFYSYLQNPNGAMQASIGQKYLSNFTALKIMRCNCPTLGILKKLDFDFVVMIFRTLAKSTDENIKGQLYSQSLFYLFQPILIPIKLWIKLLILNVFTRNGISYFNSLIGLQCQK